MFSNRILLILIPALPLFAAIATAVLGPKILRERSHWPVILGVAGSFLCSLLLLGNVRSGISEQANTQSVSIGYEDLHTYWTWLNVKDGNPEAFVYPSGDTVDEIGDLDFRVDVTLRADALTCIMLVMVTFIGGLVAIYASGYMCGDRGYWRFFAYVGLFIFSMTMLVSVSNFLLLFVFWEAVGVCSYLLIGFWYEKPSAAAAGVKAFLVNRVGDFGFAFAVFMIWGIYGTLNFHDTPEVVGVLGQARLASGAYVTGGYGLAICLLLMLGACGKSAQFPLHVWLPDAMEGPTPVSALIHAATMVTAGVYMVTRCTPLFLVSPTAQVTVACIGGGTALMAGFIALTQWDLKRVLAYSTVSQLGFMFLGLGTGTLAGIVAAMFHLFTHAFFKSLLFLGSGSVMHAMGGVIDMRRFGGLRRRMPITHVTFACGCLALAGVIPFSGFWSKDAIVASVREQASAMQSELAHRGESDPPGDGRGNSRLDQADRLVHDEKPSPAEATPHPGSHESVTTAHLAGLTRGELACGAQVYKWLYYTALLSAFLTAVYTFRAFFLTFYGDEDVPYEAGDHAHESPRSMWIPLVILSCFALAVGLVLEVTHAFTGLLVHTPSLAAISVTNTPAPAVFPSVHWDVAAVSTVIALAGLAVAAFFYLGDQKEVSAIADVLDSKLIGRPYRWAYRKFFFDEIYAWLIVKPVRAVANLAYLVDRWIVDGMVNFCGWLPKALGSLTRRLQMGLIPFYGLAMVVGMALLFAARALWGSH